MHIYAFVHRKDEISIINSNQGCVRDYPAISASIGTSAIVGLEYLLTSAAAHAGSVLLLPSSRSEGKAASSADLLRDWGIPFYVGRISCASTST